MAVVDIGLKPDIPGAIEFLKSWCGAGSVALSASHTDPVTGKKGRFETKVFPAPVDWDTLGKWIAVRQGDRAWANIYFSVNPVLSGTTDKKTARSDIAAMVALHVDIDVNAGENQVDGIKRIITVLEEYRTPPTDIVISGGGAQGYWRFGAPIPVEGSLEVAEDLKLYNLQIERDLNGDHCHNLDRIMRVPGTVNIPKEDKIAKGRKPAMASWYGSNDRRYSLGDFKKAPPPDVVKTAKYEKGFQDTGSYETKVEPTDERLKGVDKKWLDLGLTGSDPDRKYVDAGGKVDRSRRALSFCTALLRAGVDPQLVASIIMDPSWVAGDCVRDKGGETQRQLKRLIQRAGKFVGEDMDKPVLLRKGKWTEAADKFRLRADKGYWANLIHYNDQWYLYRFGAYNEIEESSVRSACRKFLDAAVIISGEGEDGKPKFDAFDPSTADVTELLNSLRDNTHADRDALEPPCWLVEEADAPNPLECLSCDNGILHVPTRQMYEATSDYFTLSMTRLSYDPKATCPLWLATLKQYWPDAADGTPATELALLQEIMGYLVTGDMSAQKMFFFLGPGRAGKGTISRIISKLIGERNVAGPSLATLGSSFGLQSLVGKTLALTGETAFGRHDDRQYITSLVKTISGQDGVDINRKNHSFLVNYKLRIRFLMLCNEIPAFTDNSRAFMTRMIALKFNISFEHREDETLEDRLALELAGILTWALEGYDRLRANHMRFTMPEASLETRENFGRLASPIRNFIDDATELGEDFYVTEDQLYTVYEKWCEASGQRPVTKVNLISGVISGNPLKLKQVRKSVGGRDTKQERARCVTGMRLNDTYGKMRGREHGAADEASKAHADQQIPF